MKTNIFYLDNSGRSCFNTCPRKYYRQMVKGQHLRHGSTALRYGTLWHAILENHYKGASLEEIIKLAKVCWDLESENLSFSDDYRHLPQAIDAYILYKNKYDLDDKHIKIIHTERHFDIPVTTTLGREIHFTGKIDMEIEMDGMSWIVENKTTGQYMPTQLMRLRNDPQIIGYAWAGKNLNNDITGCIVNMHQITGRKNKNGDYTSVQVDFARLPNFYSEMDFEEWRKSFIDTSENIIRCGEQNFWPMHRESCYTYNQNCSYLQLCDSHTPLNEVNENYYHRMWNMAKPGL